MRTLVLFAALSLAIFGCSSDSPSSMMGGGTGTGGAGAGGSGTGGTGGSGGDGGEMVAMPGGGSLPTNVADCERGCLSARQCDLDACFSDVAGRLITLCAQACQNGDPALAGLANGVCPDAGAQARSILGVTNECVGETSRCHNPDPEATEVCGEGL